ncbi:MAG: hypothetical protein IEMM0006_0263 [bacterium]|nr:MAG: hypothetical protein IEMM0006_0263 [bacterium]
MGKNIHSFHNIKYFILLFSALLLISGCSLSGGKQLVGHVYVIKKSILSPNDIISVKNPPVTPYVYTSTCSLATLPVSEKKAKIFRYDAAGHTGRQN